jgi:toxin ParE1/3/4
VRRYSVELDLGAFEDLSAIRDRVAAEAGEGVATRFIDRVLRHLDGFEAVPMRGTSRDDIREGLRVVGWRKVVTLAYVVDDAARRVLFLAVLYRGYDVEAALKARL